MLSSAKGFSSRSFTARQLKGALLKLPSSESREIRKLAKRLDERTSIGYYAALDAVAVIGVHMMSLETTKTSTIST
jgi:hypothetical protein